MPLQPAMPLGDGQVPPGAAPDGAAKRGWPRSRVLAAPRRRDSPWRACPTRSRADQGAVAMSTTAPVLEGRELTKSFYVKQGRSPLARKARVHAVEAVTVRLEAGEGTKLGGESGDRKNQRAPLPATNTKPHARGGLLQRQPPPARGPPPH